MKNFYIFRHGESCWNIEQRTQGQSLLPNPLSPKGEKDVLKIIPLLKDKEIDIIISSDLERAKQTAEIINQSLNTNLTFDKNLREINLGDAEGLLQDEIKEKLPNFINRLRTDHDKKPAPNAESINELKERVKKLLLSIAENSIENNIAISTHGMVISNFIATLDNCEYMKLSNGEIIHIIYDESKNKFNYIGKLNNK